MESRRGTQGTATLSDADRELFREAVGDAAPLPDPGRAPPAAASLRPIPAQTLKDEQAVLVEALSAPLPDEPGIEAEADSAYLRPGLSRQVLRRLRRGHWVIQAELDLHGHSRETARAELAEFLKASLRLGQRCVRVIHGKGRGSRNRLPVLRHQVRRWLAEWDEVLAYAEARPTEGGAGAVVVLLRAPGPSRR